MPSKHLVTVHVFIYEMYRNLNHSNVFIMMFQSVNARRLVAAGVGVALIAVITAWQIPGKQNDLNQQKTDTVPHRNQPASRDLDREIRQVEEATAALKDFSDTEWPKIRSKIRIDLDNLNIDKTIQNAEEAINRLDANKIGEAVNSVNVNIDIDGIAASIEKAVSGFVADIDMDEIRRDLAKAKVEIDSEMQTARQATAREVQQAIKQAQQELRKVDKTSMKAALKEAQADIDRALAEIKINDGTIESSVEELKEASSTLRGYQEMIYQMEDAQLLSTSGDYTIEYDGSIIIVNGKELDRATSDKYAKFFTGKDTKIIKRKGKIDIRDSGSNK